MPPSSQSLFCPRFPDSSTRPPVSFLSQWIRFDMEGWPSVSVSHKVAMKVNWDNLSTFEFYVNRIIFSCVWLLSLNVLEIHHYVCMFVSFWCWVAWIDRGDLSIFLLMDIWAFPRFWLLWIQLLEIFMFCLYMTIGFHLSWIYVKGWNCGLIGQMYVEIYENRNGQFSKYL